MRASVDRRNGSSREVGAVGTVAVEEQNDGGLGRGGAGATVAAFGQGDDAGAGRSRYRWRVVATAAVSDDNIADDVTVKFGNDGRNGFCFVEGWDDGGHNRWVLGRSPLA